MSTEEARMEPTSAPEPGITGTAESTTSGAGEPAKSSDPNLAEELREFGKQIETLFNTARSSARGKEIQQQLTSAWRDVERGINHTLNTAQSSDLKGTVTGTAQYAADEVQTGMARGLRNLNQWLAQKTREAEERWKAREAATSVAATQGTADDDITDRFGTNEPVFGQGLNVPAAPIHITPEPEASNADNPVSDRFSDHPIPFGEPGQSS